jgi:hypothetical protein
MDHDISQGRTTHSMLELYTIESINEGDWLLKMPLAF